MVSDADLSLAVSRNDPKELKRLLDRGGRANANFRHPSGPTYSLLSDSLKGWDKDRCSDLLLARGANQNTYIDSMPGVCWLAKYGREDTLRMLLDYMPNPRAGGMKRQNDGMYIEVPRQAWHLAMENGYPEIVVMLDRHEAYPSLADYPRPISKAQLFEPNAKGDCLLDNPATWRAFPKVLEDLEARGEWLTLEDLRGQSRDGRSWLQRGVECNRLSEVLGHLNAQGEGLRAAELVDADGGPSDLLQKIIDKQQINKLFTRENWCDASLGQLNDFYRALPEEDQQEVTNIQQLRLDISRQESLNRRLSSQIG